MATVQDNFNRSNRSLDGDTMSDGSNTWALGGGGGCSIDYNTAHSDATSSCEYCDSMPNAANIEVSCLARAKYYWNGVVSRYTDYNNFYRANTHEDYTKLHKKVGGSWSQLGSTTGSGNNATIKIKNEGTSHSVYINGSLVIGAVTDNALSTGKAGIYCRDTSSSVDDFLAEYSEDAEEEEPTLYRRGRRRTLLTNIS